ncbi:MAG: hypothetical protein JWN62_2581 [Acidimicrobiales bacterium]|nr:hypothetical protein [Acidimicrobiales bacterium]
MRSTKSVRPPRLFVRWFAMLCLPATLACSWSFLSAMTNSANTTAAEQTVEWLRGHHLGNAVSWIENAYYSHHQPPKGGTLAGGLPYPASTTPVAPPTAGSTTPTTAVDRIVPLAPQPLPGEGDWKPYGDPVGGSTAMQVAYLRPDDVHGTVLAAVVRIDQSAAAFTLMPGNQEPGHGPWTNGDAVPAARVPTLLAAFNSGFRIPDSRGAFAEDGRIVGQLRTGAASLVISATGALDVVSWPPSGAAGAPVAVRQNLDLIVDNGQLVPGLDDNTGNRWGETVGNKLFVWRSGVGVDAAGRVLYVASAGLSVRTLAALLQRAGAVRAMELDINHAWVSFNAYHHVDADHVVGSKLLAGMAKPGDRYLSSDIRDFLMVTARKHGSSL